MTPAELRDWRRARNLTQAALADIAGVSVRQVKRWEAGISPVPKLLEWYAKANP